MTHDPQALTARIASLIDENAEVYSENAMDRAFLGNSEELAWLIADVLVPSTMRVDLAWYAETFCELGQHHECCGKLTDDKCSGCRARKALENSKARLADANSKSPIQAREE